MLLSHPQGIYGTDPRLVMFKMHWILDLCLRGPEDDSVKEETFSPNNYFYVLLKSVGLV